MLRALAVAAVLVSGCRARDRPVAAAPNAPKVLATTRAQPMYLATDGEFVYWTDSDVSSAGLATSAALLKVAVDGGTPSVIAAVEEGADASFAQLVLDESDVYLVENGERDDSERILAVSKRGGPLRVIAEDRVMPTSIAMDAEFVYWVDRGDRDDGSGGLSVVRAPKRGGAIQVLAQTSIDHCADQTGLVVDDEAAYWVDRVGLFEVAKTGGRPRLLWRGRDDNGGEFPPDWFGGNLLVQLDDDLFVATLVAEVITVPKQGGREHLLAEMQENETEITGLAVGRWALYWTTLGASGPVRRASIDGSRRVELARSGFPRSLVLDRTHVYWLDSGRHAVMTMKR